MARPAASLLPTTRVLLPASASHDAAIRGRVVAAVTAVARRATFIQAPSVLPLKTWSGAVSVTESSERCPTSRLKLECTWYSESPIIELVIAASRTFDFRHKNLTDRYEYMRLRACHCRYRREAITCQRGRSVGRSVVRSLSLSHTRARACTQLALPLAFAKNLAFKTEESIGADMKMTLFDAIAQIQSWFLPVCVCIHTYMYILC